MSARRLSVIVFVAELGLLALPGTLLFVVSAMSLSALLADFDAVLGAIGTPSGGGSSLTPLFVLGAYALTFTSFWTLAVLFLVGGAERLRAASVVVWGLALLGEAIALASAFGSILVGDAKPSVSVVALLTYPALGLAVPLAHMFVAVWRVSRRGDAPGAAPAEPNAS